MGDNKRKRGRPRKPRAMRHDRQLNVAITAGQGHEIEQAARRAELLVAEWVRRALATACNSPKLPKL